MATIKSFTSLEQSKKLVEILPLESSDMYWDLLSKDKYAKVNNIGHCLCRTCVYAWSLAALLSIFEDKGFYYKLYFDGVFNVLEVTNIDNPNIHEMNYNDYSIDVCVAMIEKLHKLNLL